MNRWSLVPFALLFVCLSLATADEPTDAPPELTKAIEEGIQLLKAGENAKFLDRFVSPADRKRIQAVDSDWQKVVAGFAGKKAEVVLKGLQSIQGAQPKLSQEGTVAVFTLPKEISGGRPIGFQKVDDVWYMRN